LREETGLELESVELAFVRTLKSVRQVEVVFRGRLRAGAIKRIEKNFEIDGAEWFAADAMPRELSRDQRRVITRALAPDSANTCE
jgi:ADP-ribose pyrophosphatase YjhB (NUDIX family)